MEQINLRVKKDEKAIIENLAELQGISVAEFARRAVLTDVAKSRVDLAFDLLREGKIGRKRAWTLSGLSNLEFMDEWSKRGAEEHISDEVRAKELDLAKSIDLKKYLLKNNS